MTVWPKDNQTARNAFYGDPGKGEIAAQMVPVVPPFAMYYEGKRVKSISFHRKAAPALLAALNEIWDYCQHSQAKIDASGASKYFGAYNHRYVRGSTTKWSNHAYAAAIDLNALQNAMGVKGSMPQFITDAFCRQGAMWGGWYHDRPDWMHYEFVDNGGRKPKSAKPVWPPVARVIANVVPQAPADEIEGETSDDAPPAAPEPLPHDPTATGDPEIYAVQKRLKARHYSPGAIDGLWGSGTSGAIAGFINDRGGNIAVPASLDAFNAERDAIKAELGRAESQGWFRPVTAERASGDAKTVATVAPDVVPQKQNFLVTAWASAVAFVTWLYNLASGYVSQAWDFFTDHKDDLPTDPSYLSPAWEYVGKVPASVWIMTAVVGFGLLALNARRGIKIVNDSVTSGARQ
jgi:hypothetical protein